MVTRCCRLHRPDILTDPWPIAGPALLPGRLASERLRSVLLSQQAGRLASNEERSRVYPPDPGFLSRDARCLTRPRYRILGLDASSASRQPLACSSRTIRSRSRSGSSKPLRTEYTGATHDSVLRPDHPRSPCARTMSAGHTVGTTVDVRCERSRLAIRDRAPSRCNLRPRNDHHK